MSDTLLQVGAYLAGVLFFCYLLVVLIDVLKRSPLFAGDRAQADLERARQALLLVREIALTVVRAVEQISAAAPVRLTSDAKRDAAADSLRRALDGTEVSITDAEVLTQVEEAVCRMKAAGQEQKRPPQSYLPDDTPVSYGQGSDSPLPPDVVQ